MLSTRWTDLQCVHYKNRISGVFWYSNYGGGSIIWCSTQCQGLYNYSSVRGRVAQRDAADADSPGRIPRGTTTSIWEAGEENFKSQEWQGLTITEYASRSRHDVNSIIVDYDGDTFTGTDAVKKANEFDTDSTDDGLLYCVFCTGKQLVVNIPCVALSILPPALLMPILSQSIMTSRMVLAPGFNSK